MICPNCKEGKLEVIDTKEQDTYIIRTYKCPTCLKKITSVEKFNISKKVHIKS